MMKKVLTVILLGTLVTQLIGCAAVTALRHPDKKNLAILSHGASRENIITYLGAPVSTEKKDDQTIELYQFKQGYSGGNKAARAVTHVLLDLATIFIWELIGWPLEAVYDGTDTTIKVTYDENSKLQDFVILKQG